MKMRPHEQLRLVRMSAGLTQAAMAERLKAALGELGMERSFHQTYLSKIERGIRTPERACALAIERVTRKLKSPIPITAW